ncbi:hypothetical protein HZY86_01375 [Aerococcaceae bacterium DSM 111020]|nr:hypothetical protein [Aerococcaceae bacterium DSM 111020]
MSRQENRNIYMVLDKDNYIRDFTFEETDYLYSEIDGNITIEDFKKSIGFDEGRLKYIDGTIYFEAESQVNPLVSQVEILQKHNKFLEECILEMATIVYE